MLPPNAQLRIYISHICLKQNTWGIYRKHMDHGRTGLFYRRVPCPNPRPVAGGNSTCPASSRKMPRNNPTKPWQMYRPAAPTPRTDLGGKMFTKMDAVLERFHLMIFARVSHGYLRSHLLHHTDRILASCSFILLRNSHPSVGFACFAR